MIHLNEKLKVLERESELPDFTGAKELFLDFETENNTEVLGKDFKRYSGLYPYKGDKIGSFAVTADDHDEVYYVPMRHKQGNNLDLQVCLNWLKEHLGGPKAVESWINHYVNFDALFASCEDIRIECQLIDTLTLSKTYDSDRISHALKVLCRDLVGLPMEEELQIAGILKAMKTKNYMAVPIDIMGLYANMDVYGNRALYRYLMKNLDPSLKGIWDLEILLANILFDMEVMGIRVVELEIKKTQAICLHHLCRLGDKLSDLIGYGFTDSNKCLTDILLEQLQLPVLSTIKEKKAGGGKIDTGRPTFDKDALKLYAIHPLVADNPKAKEIIECLIRYRVEGQFLSLYCVPFLQLMDKHSLIHPRYNPVVRTGRMSCSMPNIQQQNKKSKKLLLPHRGYGFISCDYSQIEFRLIVHYIQDKEAIKAYNEDPNTDFHQWVMELIGTTDRTAAKTVNFGSAYGQGKNGVTTQLAGNADVLRDINKLLDEMVYKGEITREQRSKEFERLCKQKANIIYETYHERLPGIKRTSNKAANLCKRRGWIKTAYGRRRHLPGRLAFRAFNSVIQGTAMDIIKEAMINLSPRHNETSREMGLLLNINVHDEIVLLCPLDRLLDPVVHTHIVNVLESPSVKFSVPIKVGLGVSRNNWAEASGDETFRDEDGVIIGGKII